MKVVGGENQREDKLKENWANSINRRAEVAPTTSEEKAPITCDIFFQGGLSYWQKLRADTILSVTLGSGTFSGLLLGVLSE